MKRSIIVVHICITLKYAILHNVHAVAIVMLILSYSYLSKKFKSTEYWVFQSVIIEYFSSIIREYFNTFLLLILQYKFWVLLPLVAYPKIRPTLSAMRQAEMYQPTILHDDVSIADCEVSLCTGPYWPPSGTVNHRLCWLLHFHLLSCHHSGHFCCSLVSIICSPLHHIP